MASRKWRYGFKKKKFLLSQNINLIRVREYPLKLLSENDVIVIIGRSLEKKTFRRNTKEDLPIYW